MIINVYFVSIILLEYGSHEVRVIVFRLLLPCYHEGFLIDFCRYPALR